AWPAGGGTRRDVAALTDAMPWPHCVALRISTATLTGSKFGPSARAKLRFSQYASSLQVFSAVCAARDPAVDRHERVTSNSPRRRHPLAILRGPALDGTALEGKGPPELWPGHAYALPRWPTF